MRRELPPCWLLTAILLFLPGGTGWKGATIYACIPSAGATIVFCQMPDLADGGSALGDGDVQVHQPGSAAVARTHRHGNWRRRRYQEAVNDRGDLDGDYYSPVRHRPVAEAALCAVQDLAECQAAFSDKARSGRPRNGRGLWSGGGWCDGAPMLCGRARGGAPGRAATRGGSARGRGRCGRVSPHKGGRLWLAAPMQGDFGARGRLDVLGAAYALIRSPSAVLLFRAAHWPLKGPRCRQGSGAGGRGRCRWRRSLPASPNRPILG